MYIIKNTYSDNVTYIGDAVDLYSIKLNYTISRIVNNNYIIISFLDTSVILLIYY